MPVYDHSYSRSRRMLALLMAASLMTGLLLSSPVYLQTKEADTTESAAASSFADKDKSKNKNKDRDKNKSSEKDSSSSSLRCGEHFDSLDTDTAIPKKKEGADRNKPEQDDNEENSPNVLFAAAHLIAFDDLRILPETPQAPVALSSVRYEELQKACAACKKDPKAQGCAPDAERTNAESSRSKSKTHSCAVTALLHPITRQLLFCDQTDAIDLLQEAGFLSLGSTLSVFDLQKAFSLYGLDASQSAWLAEYRAEQAAGKKEEEKKKDRDHTARLEKDPALLVEFVRDSSASSAALSAVSRKEEAEPAESADRKKSLAASDSESNTKPSSSSVKKSSPLIERKTAFFQGKLLADFQSALKAEQASAAANPAGSRKQNPSETKESASSRTKQNTKPLSAAKARQQLLDGQPLMKTGEPIAFGPWTLYEEDERVELRVLPDGKLADGQIQVGKADMFYESETASLGRDVWVLDADSQSVRYFDENGTLVRTPFCLDGRFYLVDPKTGSLYLDYADLEAKVEALIRKYSRKGEQIAFGLRDLSTGDSIVLHSKAQQSASVMKAFVMGAIFDQYEDYTKRYGKSYIDSQLSVMISISANNAWVALVDVLGGGDYVKGLSVLNKWNKDHGYKDTSMSNKAYGNYTSAKDASQLLADIALGKLKHADQMQALLESQAIGGRLLQGLPKDLVTGNKPGWVPGTENDTMLVEAPFGEYVITLLCTDMQQTSRATTLMKEISSLVYTWMKEHHPPADANWIRIETADQ